MAEFNKIILISCIFVLFFPGNKILAQVDNGGDRDSTKKLHRRVESFLNGFMIGKSTHVFPYASLEDWFDPFAGLKLGHSSLVNSEDKIYHHFKFEGIDDYSWKFRYLAHSISSEKTKFSFLFKRKTDQDLFFYDIGNSTLRSGRIATKYSSIFFGGEIRHNISDRMALSWSPGFWKFTSGLLAGGEFEEASNVKYISSRFSLSDIKLLDYWKSFLDNQWSAYIEIALPVKTRATTYARFNLQSLTLFNLFKGVTLDIGTRFEYLVSSDRKRVPYYALPEVGSRTGLRGFSKERFRNFAIAAYNFELSLPLSRHIDGFILADIAHTASNPVKIPGKQLHANFGVGLRLVNANYPITIGIARSDENLKLFSSIAIGRPW